MELYHLTAFVTVAKTGNLTRAAENLHISPSALSAHIKGLEDELGVILFQRLARGMQLTAQGEILLHHAKSALDAIGDFKSAVKAVHPPTAAVLKIGLNASPAFLKMTALSQGIADTLPEVQIRYVTSHTVMTAPMLQNHDIDLGFVFGDQLEEELQSDIAITPIAPVKMRVVIPQAFIEQCREPSWEEVVQMSWIWADKNVACHTAFKKELDRRRLGLNTVTYAMDDGIIQQLVKDGRGVAIMRDDEAEKLAKEGIVRVWQKGTVTVPLGIACLKDNYADQLIAKVREIVLCLWSE
jgi:DNA-binding transcriptional LysR family regulator